MSVEAELARLSPDRDMMLTVGVFDGVHLGHKYLIAQLIEQSRQHDLLSGVVTFHQHPQEVLATEAGLSFLTDLAERSSLLKNEGVEVIIPLSFTTELARLGARQFVSLLKKHLRMRGLVVGPDFALGRDREGDADTLRGLGREMDFIVTVVPRGGKQHGYPGSLSRGRCGKGAHYGWPSLQSSRSGGQWDWQRGRSGLPYRQSGY